MVSTIITICYYALLIYFIVMWGRFILDISRSFAPQWRPRGALLVVAELIYTVTDPPLRAIRRVVPPLRIGGLALDFGWTIVFLAVVILLRIAGTLRYLV